MSYSASVIRRERASTELELATTSEGHTVLHPSRGRLRSWYLGSVLVGIPLLGALVLRGLLEMPWWGALLLVAGGLALGVACYRQRLWMETTTLTPASLVTRTWYGRTRTVPRAAIREAVFATVSTTKDLLHYLLFVGAGGRCLARASVEAISRDSQLAFAQRLGVPVRDLTPDGATSFEELRRRYPGSVSWAAAHPLVVGLLATLLILLLAVGTIVGAVAIDQRPIPMGQAVELHCKAGCAGSGHDEVGTVHLLRVVDPAQGAPGSRPPADAERLVAVEVEWTGTSTTPVTDQPIRAIQVVDSQGTDYVSCQLSLSEGYPDCATQTTAGQAIPSQVTLSRGRSARGYLTFQVPQEDQVAKVEYSEPSGATMKRFSGATVDWQVTPPRP